MFSFQRSLIAAAGSALLLAATVDQAGSQTAGTPEPKTPAEAAQAIAHAIDGSLRKRPSLRAPIAFESATSHNNVVEVHYRANDARLFPHNEAERDQRRLGLTGYFCFDSRILPFRKDGVVIHHVLAAPDDTNSFEFTIDQSTCAALVDDAKARAEAAERERLEFSRPTEPKHVRTMTIRPDQAGQK